MVVKMIRWPTWSMSSRRFEAKLIVKRLEGLKSEQSDCDNDDASKKKVVIEIKWNGPKSIVLGRLKRYIKRNLTEEGRMCGDGVFEWNEEFNSVCNLSGYKEGAFHPWEVLFTVFKELDQGSTNKFVVVGTAALNLGELVATSKEKELAINVSLATSRRTVEDNPKLILSVELMEMGAVQESLRAVQRSTETILEQPCSPKTSSPRRSELYGLRASLRKVRLCHGMNEPCTEFEDCKAIQCARNEDTEYNHPFDTDSLADDNEQDIDEMSNQDSDLKLSVNYNTLPYANFVGESYANTQDGIEDESWIHYPNHNLKVESSCVEYFTATGNDQYSRKNPKGRILSWRTKKLRFNSSKPKTKGEPLLKKGYGDEGGDDIDFDRRHLSSCDESTLGWNTSEEGSTTSRSSFSEFGDDNFTVGSWEHKEIISRDGMMKLQVEVFFASIDQRSERAAGESACTTLVAVIANWLQSSQYDVPNKSEFDRLIRDGSLEWRNLCENEGYIQQFPDKHFDLETVLQAKIRPLSVASDKSFIGFFQPEGLEGGNFDFLNDAMSFDSIWDEIRRHGSEWDGNSAPLVYIVSWNDHFFILKVTNDAYYIIDTLGERLYEGCNEAYVLKFDKDTTIQRLPKKVKASDEKSINDKVKPGNLKEKGSRKETRERTPNEVDKTRMEEEIVFKGRESCKEYIKSFMAAIPIRELKADIKKGLMASTPLHQRLQIEFHYTHLAHILIE